MEILLHIDTDGVNHSPDSLHPLPSKLQYKYGTIVEECKNSENRSVSYPLSHGLVVLHTDATAPIRDLKQVGDSSGMVRSVQSFLSEVLKIGDVSSRVDNSAARNSM
jgi:hypothetical protein